MKSSANQRRGASLVHLAVSTILLLGCLCLPSIAWAQSTATGGQIVGQVEDTSGAAIAGAEVTVRNKNTNYTRTVTTDDAGRYTIPLVPTGPYEVVCKASGFEPSGQEILITLGSSVGANFSLTVGATSDVVEVSASAGSELSIEPTRTSAQSVITDLQIRELPANGRRFQDFIQLTPTVAVEPERNGLSISGQRGVNNNINIDGADYNQPFFGGIRGGERAGFAFTVSQEAIQEFQVARNTFSAEFGRSTGGVVNAITKSGTNQFHGSVFYLFRNEDLTAKDPLNRKPLAKQQQFGGSLGGPIIKDRTFFFTALDFQDADEPITVLYTTLDTRNVRNTPGAQALLGVAPDNVGFSKTNDAQAILGRIDHRLFGNNNLSARFNFSNNKGINATSAGGGVQTTTNSALSNNGIERDRTYTTVIQLTSVISSNLINEFRFQYSREERPRINNGPGPEVTVLEGGSTVAIYGQRAFLPIEQFDDRYQVTNNISVIKGAHNTKFGFDFNRVFVDQIFRSDAAGVYRFNSLSDYLMRRPSQYRQFAGSGVFQASQKELAFYVQDEWRVRPGLTITPGFRYEAVFNPQYITATSALTRPSQATTIPDDKREYAPRLGIAWDVRNNGKNVLRLGGGLFYARTPLLLFNQAITNNGGNPDLGQSLTLSGSAITSAFSAVGINLANASLSNLPIFTQSQLAQLFRTSTARPTVAFFDPEFRNPRATQFNAAFDHQLMPGLIVGVDFSYINTVRLERLRDINLPAPIVDATGRNIYSGPRPNNKFFIIRSQESSARSLYRALTVSVNLRRQRYVLDAYYTLSSNYSDDDNERNFAGIQYDDVNNLANEYNFSRLDQRHQFTANGAVTLPFSFQISGTMRIVSARPFTPTGAPFKPAVDSPAGMPIIPSGDLNRDSQFTDRPIINGRVNTRNTERNMSLSDVSLRVQRAFNMPSEKGKITVSFEMFNLFNFDNAQLAGPSQVFGPGFELKRDGTPALQNGKPVVLGPSPNFRQLRNSKGQYLSSTSLGDPFLVQLGVRYSF
ncbi:MAG: TonB-dependent receptor [Acidobacteriota bacterium]